MDTASNPAGGRSGVAAGENPLAEIDRLMQQRADDERRADDENQRATAERSEFSTEFERICKAHVRPPMEAVIERLERNGGGGVIEERPEDVSRGYTHRLVMWMSLSGSIAGPPRQDRYPYLQLDADVERRVVLISEGDMWQGGGGNTTGRTGEWKLSEITEARVTEKAIEILRRSCSQGATG